MATLSPNAQSILASAMDQGLVKVSRAIELLTQNPQADLGELLPASVGKGASVWPEKQEQGASAASACPAVESAQAVSGVSVSDTACIPVLTALIRACYPDMPSVAAEALSSAPTMEGLRAVFSAHESLFASPQFHSDFIVVTFYGLLRQARQHLDQVILQSPAIQQALRQSGAGWPD